MKNDYDIAQIYKEMELHLISSMQRNLGKHLKDEIAEGKEWKMWQAEKLKELKRYQRQNKDIVSFYTSGLSKDIADILKEEFRQGHKSELNKYNKLFDKNISDSFFKLDDRKANTLIKVVNDDLDIANKAVLRMMNDTYRQTIHKAATFANTGVMTQKQAVDMATKDFLSRGLAVIEYKDGKRVNIASYSQMAVRTASQRAMLMGEGEFRKSIGETLVIISKHGTACKLCQPHEGNVYIDDVYSGGKPDGKHKLLSDAMEENLFHPNCRHGVSTYYGLDDEEEQETTVNVPKENNNEDAARIDREIQKEKRKVAGFQSPDNLKTAQQRLKELEIQKEIAPINYLDDTLKGIDSKLLEENKQQLENLTNKYPKMKRYFKENNLIVDANNEKNNIFATTTKMQDFQVQKITLNKYYYKDYKKLVEEERKNVASNFAMLCSDKKLSVYTITHEYGHSIHNVLVKDYIDKNQNIKDLLNIKRSALDQRKLETTIVNQEVKKYLDEIENIAKENNPNITLASNLSRYGKKNYREAFAEIFANSQCGEPNELGKAMNKFLEKRLK